MPDDKGSFAGKVAFVTGAANGIGRAAALAFAHEGVIVVAADLSEHANQETARMIEEAGGRALPVKCDVSRDNDVKAGLEKTVKTFGRRHKLRALQAVPFRVLSHFSVLPA